MTLTQTQLRKCPRGKVVALSSAPFVRFKRGDDGQWYEVPRHGVTPRTYKTADLFALGVDTLDE